MTIKKLDNAFNKLPKVERASKSKEKLIEELRGLEDNDIKNIAHMLANKLEQNEITIDYYANLKLTSSSLNEYEVPVILKAYEKALINNECPERLKDNFALILKKVREYSTNIVKLANNDTDTVFLYIKSLYGDDEYEIVKTMQTTIDKEFSIFKTTSVYDKEVLSEFNNVLKQCIIHSIKVKYNALLKAKNMNKYEAEKDINAHKLQVIRKLKKGTFR